MRASEVERATAAAARAAASFGLPVSSATALHSSNALTLRLLPCDVVARVSTAPAPGAAAEVELALRLSRAGAPVVAPCPLVPPHAHDVDGFVITFWTHHDVDARQPVPPHDGAAALHRLHAHLREVDVGVPVRHASDRVDDARRLLLDRSRTPRLLDADRQILLAALDAAGPALHEHEQLLHGEPHPGNLLPTRRGPLFVDWETRCTGPVEFDLAHAPDGVAEHYPGVDQDLLRRCRTVVLAMITTWRWDVEDQLPDGARLGATWLAQLRATFPTAGATTGPRPASAEHGDERPRPL